MKTGFQVHKSDWVVTGVFLLAIGLYLLFMIDFFWGFLCLCGAYICYHEAKKARQRENDVVPDQGPAEGG